MSKSLGLRIDVDTLRGTRQGVPNLQRLLKTYNVTATFFFSVGPDNMGRHLWRLLKPTFLVKMLRTNAPGLYGWDIVLRGTFWPGPIIGERCAAIIRETHSAGHEIGLHACDHHAWQKHLESWSPDMIYAQLKKGDDALFRITGERPICSATPGWRTTQDVIEQKEHFRYRFNSDCRGNTLFSPQSGEVPQVPNTLPTYDEVVGTGGITDATYNQHILQLIKEDQLNVLTIHAEAEGMSKASLFKQFLESCREQKINVVSLGTLLDQEVKPLPVDRISRHSAAGREGWIAYQASTIHNSTHSEG